MEYTRYWKESMDDICNEITALLASDGLHPVFHWDMHYFLELADRFTEEIDNMLIRTDHPLSPDKISMFIFRVRMVTNHLAIRPRIMMDYPSMYENQELEESECSQLQTIYNKALKLNLLVANADNYYKFLLGEKDVRDLEFTDMDVQLLVRSPDLQTSSKQRNPVWFNPTYVVLLDHSTHILVDKFHFWQILSYLCVTWFSSTLAPETAVNITVSKDIEVQMAKFIFEYPDLSITADELNNRLNPEYALQHNMLDLILVKQLAQWLHGKFESNVNDQKVTFTVYLPLSKDIEIV